MISRAIQSEAFRRAALGSERIRIIWLLGVLGVLLLIVTAPTLVARDPQHLHFLPSVLALLLFFAALELIRLAVVNRCIEAARDLPAWTWFLNVAVETLLPTAAILLLTKSPFFAPQMALVAPPVLFYFLFIILSTLRLSPLLCSLTGLLSAGGYLAVAAYTGWQNAAVTPDVGFPLTRFVSMGAILLALGGFVAAAVAKRIRIHVVAALQEAEERHRAERLEHDLDIARSIQQRLLPRNPPKAAGFDIAAWSQPADQTGGDYYDWLSLASGEVVLSLADVSGHGIGPALLTVDCHAYWRAILPHGGGLGELLTRLNQSLAADMPSDRFITYVAALVEPNTGGVQLLSAGHGPLLVYTAADRRLQSLNADGLPLGVDAAFEYGPPRQFILAPGDSIILATDGFFEWANSGGEQFGVERLAEAIRAATYRPAREIISSLYTAVVEFADGASQQDDITAIVIKRTAATRVS